MGRGHGVFFCQQDNWHCSFYQQTAIKVLARHTAIGCEASCHGQLSNGAIAVPYRSLRAVFSILFDNKLPLVCTVATTDQSEHIFDNHYSTELRAISIQSQGFNFLFD
jgi:hypothetical protein